MSAILAFERVACIRGDRLLFEGLSFTLTPGEALLVTGPNGVGKSSLIRLAAGLLRPMAGKVLRTAPAALADEAAALDPELPLGDALAFWARLDGGDACAGIAALALEPLAAVPVRLLSTGQRRRAALARVVAARAPLWLLDEPGNGLDAGSLDRLAAAARAHLAGGGAILAASHQPLGLPARELAL